MQWDDALNVIREYRLAGPATATQFTVLEEIAERARAAGAVPPTSVYRIGDEDWACTSFTLASGWTRLATDRRGHLLVIVDGDEAETDYGPARDVEDGELRKILGRPGRARNLSI